MEEKKEEALRILSEVLDKSTASWTDVRDFCGTVLDCTEFIIENKPLRLSKGLLGSSRQIETILRAKNDDLLRDFQIMSDIVIGILEIYADRSRGIDMAILVSSEALDKFEDLEED